jgi:ribosome-binding factor A
LRDGARPSHVARREGLEVEFKRSDRVAERVKADLSELLLKKVNDPRIGFVSITRVRASDDLRNMTVYVSVFGADEAAKKRTLDGLRSATPFLQREVFRRLEIKVSTELAFRLDDSLEKGHQVLQAIKEAVESDQRDPQ